LVLRTRSVIFCISRLPGYLFSVGVNLRVALQKLISALCHQILILLTLYSTENFSHKKGHSFKSPMYLLSVAVSYPNSRNVTIFQTLIRVMYTTT
jgi:hypothetical protein